MFQRFFATTAIIGVLSGVAVAQEAETVDPSANAPAAGTVGYFVPSPDQVLATTVIGKTVFTGVDEDAEAVGEVSDVVIGPSGGTDAVVIGVGGFLGLGEKDVAVNFDRISWSDKDGQRIIVISATKDDLKNAPRFDRKTITEGAVPEKAEATTPVVPITPVAPDVAANEEVTVPSDSTTDPMVTREGLQTVDPALLSAGKIIGSTVYASDDSSIGKIKDVILTQDGKVDAYIVDVGGFLSVGAKPVALGADNLEVLADAKGEMSIYSPFSKAQLQSQPAYSTSAYKTDRDGMLLRAPSP
ncbi:PRC-barrel domain-containing protein [Rhizobium sp. CFBP 8762]|uniref:PRC-barrel domain-containing protein n=1 Tax=Rhizobium sp. CFBP 8762 TaxID=2775279 RepID=UPI00178032CC|nr:PRC-barrel domain-containing protein [Rhizobium sp. CFBP 8762]MBD8553388.1 PRC-barrel domain-containing protein [Rhizobium sp. CFBP 8762]